MEEGLKDMINARVTAARLAFAQIKPMSAMTKTVVGGVVKADSPAPDTLSVQRP